MLADDPLFKIRGIANYQFGIPVGESLFPDDCAIEFSPSTGRIRRISYKGKLLATLRPNDGRLALTLWGAKRLHQATAPPRLRVVIPNDVTPFISKGRSVFTKHVLRVDPLLRAGDEALVVDEQDHLIAVGVTLLAPQEILDLSRGVAVKIRHSLEKSSRKSLAKL